MAMLKRYINRNATMIQKNWRGHFVRKVRLPVARRMAGVNMRLEALIVGWRVRKIMQTKEIDMRITQIRDFERELQSADLDEAMTQGLIMSRNNTVSKMICLISKMQEKGLWLTYKQLENKQRRAKEAFKTMLSNEKSIAHQRSFSVLETRSFLFGEGYS
jgi:hypothetical protein